MSRARSKTVDSAEVKKKGIPRRLNEKIALIKEKEQAQSEAFEQAMRSILEMQQARTGGGSMPSLQAIDTSPPMTYTTETEGMICLTTPPASTVYRERPNSVSLVGRRSPGIERTQSCDTSGHQSASSTHQFWNNNEWMEPDLSRHKSDSDLQQSLLIDAYHSNQAPAPTTLALPSITSPIVKVSPPFDGSIDTRISSNLDVNNSNRPQSPTRLGSSVSAALLSPEYGAAGMGGDSMGGGASSLPDLTNVEFSCGLDIPLEKDEDILNFVSNKPTGYYPSQSSGYTVYPQQVMPLSMHGVPPNISLIGGGIPNSNFPAPPTHPYLSQLPISKGIPGHAPQQQHSMPLVRKLKSIVPATTPPGGGGYGHPSRTGQSGMLSYGAHKFPPNVSITTPTDKYTPINGMTPPTIQAPPTIHTPPSSNSHFSLPFMAPAPLPVDPSLLSPTHPYPFSKLPGATPLAPPPYSTIPSYLDPGMAYQKQALQQKMANMNFNAPPLRSHSEENLITTTGGKEGGGQAGAARLDEIHQQQNPFMGNMSSANSVPCVYVEPSSIDPCVDQPDSPTTGTGSPSTSASHASSPPPASRPHWLEQHPQAMSDYMFHEWPVEGMMVGGAKYGSPLSHHRSLSELNKMAADYVMDLSPGSQSRAHQLSLPSIVMNDLITSGDMDDPGMGGVMGVDKQLSFLGADFEMEDEMMESLLRDEGFGPFTIEPTDMVNSSDLMGHNGGLNF